MVIKTVPKGDFLRVIFQRFGQLFRCERINLLIGYVHFDVSRELISKISYFCVLVLENVTELVEHFLGHDNRSLRPLVLSREHFDNLPLNLREGIGGHLLLNVNSNFLHLLIVEVHIAGDLILSALINLNYRIGIVTNAVYVKVALREGILLFTDIGVLKELLGLVVDHFY